MHIVPNLGPSTSSTSSPRWTECPRGPYCLLLFRGLVLQRLAPYLFLAVVRAWSGPFAPVHNACHISVPSRRPGARSCLSALLKVGRFPTTLALQHINELHPKLSFQPHHDIFVMRVNVIRPARSHSTGSPSRSRKSSYMWLSCAAPLPAPPACWRPRLPAWCCPGLWSLLHSQSPLASPQAHPEVVFGCPSAPPQTSPPQCHGGGGRHLCLVDTGRQSKPGQVMWRGERQVQLSLCRLGGLGLRL